MTIDDAEHYTAEERARIAASYPPHEQEARLRGRARARLRPHLSGRPRRASPATRMPIPRHWPQIGGLDFGWDHPTAAVKLAWDRDADVVYVMQTYRAREATPLIHSGALKPWGAIPVGVAA